jgi:DNA-directed RNA polymerase III subunit RPC1
MTPESSTSKPLTPVTPRSGMDMQDMDKKGLTPTEFFTHQQGGREGLLSTAISTSTTGYLQRRIVKTMEDVKSSHTHTIINQKGKVVQFAYGDDGMDTAKMVYVKGTLSFIDIYRKVDQLNNAIENQMKK